MNYEILKNAISEVIKTNGNNEITGQLLQDSLLAIVDSLGLGYQFLGVATEETVPPEELPDTDCKIFYVTYRPGIYTHFNNIEVGDREIGFLVFTEGEWTKETVYETGTISQEELQEIINTLN